MFKNKIFLLHITAKTSSLSVPQVPLKQITKSASSTRSTDLYKNFAFLLALLGFKYLILIFLFSAKPKSVTCSLALNPGEYARTFPPLAATSFATSSGIPMQPPVVS